MSRPRRLLASTCLALGLLVGLLAWAAPLLALDSSALEQGDPRAMRFPPVEFTPPEPERVVLPNGLVVYLLEDHELPLITVTAMIRAGGWLDPSDKVGLASLVGVVMRTGGTARMTPEQLDEEVESLAAQLAVGLGTEAGFATLDVLAKDLPRALRLLGDVLRTPAFDPGRLELEKLQVLESIRRRQDRPQTIAGREMLKLLYGPKHPLAREAAVESITRIAREDLIAFHRRYIHPNGLMLGITGHFDRRQMLALLREVFGDWPSGVVPSIVYPPIAGEDGADSRRLTRDGHDASALASGRTVRFIAKGTSQAHLRLGQLAVLERDPDYPALALLNDILGGGSFRSRLFKDVRTLHGLAYSVGSTLRAGSREPGIWVLRAETKAPSAEDVIQRMLANLERLRRQPVTDAELEEAKEAFVNSFVFSFTSPASVVNRLMSLEYDGLPKDFLQQLRDRVLRLTKEDLLRVAQTHLRPERLKILAVGPAELLTPVLAHFGEVREITLDDVLSTGASTVTP